MPLSPTHWSLKCCWCACVKYWTVLSLLPVPLQRLGNRWPIRCRKLGPTHDSKSSLLKVRHHSEQMMVLLFRTCFIVTTDTYLDLFWMENANDSQLMCFFAPLRCEWIEDAGSRPRGCGLPAGAALRLQALPELPFPLPQTRGNRWTSHQPPRIGSCRDQPQVRKRSVHIHTRIGQWAAGSGCRESRQVYQSLMQQADT